MANIKEVTVIFFVFLMIIQCVSAISNVQHSVDGNRVILTYQGTPPIWINIRGDTNIGQSGGYLWVKTNSNSFSYDMSFAINPSKKFYYGVKDTSWSSVYQFSLTGTNTQEVLQTLNDVDIIEDSESQTERTCDQICSTNNKVCVHAESQYLFNNQWIFHPQTCRTYGLNTFHCWCAE